MTERRIETSIPATPLGLAQALDATEDAFARLGAPKATIRRLALCADELIGNLLRHDPTVGPDHSIDLTAAREGGGFSLVMSCPGQPFDPTGHELPLGGTESGGRGLLMTRALLDEFTYARIGGRNVMRMTVRDRACAPVSI